MAATRPVHVAVVGPAEGEPGAVAARVVERLAASGSRVVLLTEPGQRVRSHGGGPDVVVEAGAWSLAGAEPKHQGPRRRHVPVPSRRRRPDLAVLCQPYARVREVSGADGAHAELLAWERLLEDQPTLIAPTAVLGPDEITTEICGAIDDVRGRYPAPRGSRRPWIAPAKTSAVATAHARSALALLLHPASRRAALMHGAAGAMAMVGPPVDRLPFPVEAIAADLQLPWDGVAMWRSHSRRRWVAVFSHHGEVVAVVKIAPESDTSLEREADVIAAVGAFPRDVVVPGVLGRALTQGWRAVAFTAINPEHPAPADLDDAVRVCVALRWCRDGAGVTHGDVAEWNLVRLDDGRIGLLDWEMADLRMVGGYDLMHYLHCSGHLDGVDLGQPLEGLDDLPAEAARAVTAYLAAAELSLSDVLPAVRQFTS